MASLATAAAKAPAGPQLKSQVIIRKRPGRPPRPPKLYLGNDGGGGAVDADFIQSAARVGDYIGITLTTGASFEGLLSELTLDRLSLQLPDGRKMAVALKTVATAMQSAKPSGPGNPQAPLGTVSQLPEPALPGIPVSPTTTSAEPTLIMQEA